MTDDILKRLYDQPCEEDESYGPLLCGLRLEAMEEIKKQRARIAELEAALEPFADCGVWDGYKDEEVFKLGFKIGDLRAARAALEKKNV